MTLWRADFRLRLGSSNSWVLFFQWRLKFLKSWRVRSLMYNLTKNAPCGMIANHYTLGFVCLFTYSFLDLSIHVVIRLLVHFSICFCTYLLCLFIYSRESIWLIYDHTHVCMYIYICVFWLFICLFIYLFAVPEPMSFQTCGFSQPSSKPNTLVDARVCLVYPPPNFHFTDHMCFW